MDRQDSKKRRSFAFRRPGIGEAPKPKAALIGFLSGATAVFGPAALLRDWFVKIGGSDDDVDAIRSDWDAVQNDLFSAEEQVMGDDGADLREQL